MIRMDIQLRNRLGRRQRHRQLQLCVPLVSMTGIGIVLLGVADHRLLWPSRIAERRHYCDSRCRGSVLGTRI
jgi:hypothetical protein